MFTIKAEFRRLSEITLTDIYDEMGVYVLWSGKASVRPTYIGEGEILKRFVNHLDKKWAARPLSGLMAVMQGPVNERKWQAETIESVLLFIADETDRFPPNNKSKGKWSGFASLLKRKSHNVFKVSLNISGYDPLMPPKRPRMQTCKHIDLQYIEDEGWNIKHQWNRRNA